MDWTTFEKNIRNWTSQTYDIVVDNMDLSDWDKFIALIETKNYVQSFAIHHCEPQRFVDKNYLWDFFKNGSEFWPSITLKIGDLQMESFIKTKKELEIWFNDSYQETEGLNEKKYDRLIEFMIETSKNLGKSISFMHEDAIQRYLIFRVDKTGIIDDK